ncbi:hypothetical protein P8452_69106 [Trifolium repens]|nr:hypothetical protein P8452_69106 [Trifolium repens]
MNFSFYGKLISYQILSRDSFFLRLPICHSSSFYVFRASLVAGVRIGSVFLRLRLLVFLASGPENIPTQPSEIRATSLWKTWNY